MKRIGLILLALVGSSVAPPPPPPIPRPTEPVGALPEKATQADRDFQPYLDYDTDGCYNVAAINDKGETSKGLHSEGGADNCRDEADLDNSNAYARARCNNNWCFYLYDYYFERDSSSGNFGHTHDWEHIGVWVKNGRVEWIALSGHGKYEIKKRDDVLMDGEHVKAVYHKDSSSTHAFRFANNEDDGHLENHKNKWWASKLVSYNGFPEGVRDKLFGAKWGTASMAIEDSAFPGQIEKAKPNEVGEFDVNKDEGSPGDP